MLEFAESEADILHRSGIYTVGQKTGCFVLRYVTSDFPKIDGISLKIRLNPYKKWTEWL